MFPIYGFASVRHNPRFFETPEIFKNFDFSNFDVQELAKTIRFSTHALLPRKAFNKLRQRCSHAILIAKQVTNLSQFKNLDTTYTAVTLMRDIVEKKQEFISGYFTVSELQ